MDLRARCGGYEGRTGRHDAGGGAAEKLPGGLAAGLAVLDEIGEQVLDGTDRLNGNILFLAVPDEESYSAGMRGAAGFLMDLREREGLSYDLLIDLARIGLGIAFIPDYCVPKNSDQLFVVQTEEQLPKRQLVAAWNGHVPVSRATQAFLDYFHA